jgi:hypothetical protein
LCKLKVAYFTGKYTRLTMRDTLKVIVEFDLKSLLVPVTAVTQHFYFAFGGKSVIRGATQWNKAQ